ncbi:MAG TPA: glycosyltransferase [Ignavibacteriaceae bacterium]|nr:glycosyltransferase [Ignavibacteriaceae bacterium]
MFKVLVISYYFPPMGLSGVQRTFKFTKYMKQYNWEPVVLTTESTAYYAHDESLLKEAQAAGIRIVRSKGNEINSKLGKQGTVKIPPEWIRKLLSRLSAVFYIPDNKKSWSVKALPAARKLLKEEEFEMIFVSAPPFSSFDLAVKLKKEFNLPLVIDYRDLWYGNQFSFYLTPLHSYLHRQMEYAVLKAADRIIVINRRMKEKIMKRYGFLTFEDVYIIPQGYDPQDFQNIIPEKKNNNKMRLTYSGLFYEFITPKYFLQAFKQLSLERPDIAANIELHFIGLLRNENRKLARKLDLQSFVKEHGYLDHRDSLVKLMSSDVLWVMVGDRKNADTVSTGKSFEYFGTRKPVIASVPTGALKTAMEEYGAAFITAPYDVESIKNAIMTAYEMYTNNSLPVPNEEFIEKYRRDYLTELLTKQFQFLIKAEI